ncbi:MAG: hypothetical protein K1Y02_18400 [Candidatus Hydrogenedentes bacterium]|nr:hypothetical protein [Candidatus Hydrogenedentota bacterium]
MSAQTPSRRYSSSVFGLVIVLFALGGLILLAFKPGGNASSLATDASPKESMSANPSASPDTGAAPANASEGEASASTPEAPPAVAAPQDSAPAPSLETLKVIGTFPVEGERLDSDIVVYFSEPVVVTAGQGQETPNPFTMQPNVEGTFKVVGNCVAFKSDKFPFDQTIEVQLSDAIRSTSGKPLDPGTRTLHFAKFAFEPARMWTLEESDNKTVLGVRFPATVDAAAMQPQLAVRDADGQPVTFSLQPGDEGGNVRLTIEGQPKWPVSVTFPKGLADASKSMQMQAERVFTYPTQLNLTLEKVEWAKVEDEEQQIRLRFSQAVEPGILSEYVTIKDHETSEDVPYSVSTDQRSNEQLILVNLEDAGETTLDFTIAAGLPGADRTRVAEAISRVLDAPQPESQPFEVTDQWWEGYGQRSGLKLSIGFNQRVELKDILEHLSAKPEVPNLRVEPSYNRSRVYILGEWDSNKTYELTFSEGMKYGEGAALTAPVTRLVQTEKVPVFLGFGQEGKCYFPRRDGLPLSLDSRNVTKARVRIGRLFPSNIAVALSDLENGKPNWRFMQSWSQDLESKDFEVAAKTDRLTSTPLPLDTLLPSGKNGVFALSVADASPDAEGDYERDSKLLLFTNIGLLAHWMNDELVIFAHNLYSLEPLSLAKVTVYSIKNQLLGTANTDAQGMAKLGPFDTSLGVPGVAVVESGDDYTFIELKARDDESIESADGMPRFDRKAYDAFVYADRELYRPGETAHLRWIVRTGYGDALANVPLLLKIVKPNGQDLASEPITLSALGTGGTDVATQKSYPTGKYTANVLVPGNETPIGSYQFSIEEFVPNRMKAAVNVTEPSWSANADYTIQLNAQHLYGAPATDRDCEMKVVLKPGVFEPEAWKGFTFGNDTEFATAVEELGDSKTDAQGNASFTFKYLPKPEANRPLTAIVLGRVFELGGRAVSGTKEIPLFPSDICLGIAGTTPEGGKGIDVDVAAVTPAGAAAALPSVKVTLERQTWNYYVRRYYDSYQPKWSESFQEVETKDVPLTDGKGKVTFTMENYGYYRVRVHSDQTPQFSTLSFYSYGGECNIVNPSRPSLIKLTLDKPSYAVGDEAVVKIEAPFDGKGFVVVQGQEIQRILSIDIKDGVGSAKLPLTREQYPNVWIEATVVHAIKEGSSQVYPFSSFAAVPLKVNDPRRSIAIAYPGLPEEIRPAQDTQVTVETKDADGQPVSVEVTLAAIDEGIHSITGYASPDPVSYLSRLRQPDFRRTHYYDKVAYDFEKPAPGGDIEALLAKRASAVDENWIKPVALWSGVVTTDAQGKATVAMSIPEFTGQLRLVAVAASASAAGAQTGYVYVRRPYVLQTSMPRFLLPGDKFQSKVVLNNNSPDEVKAVVGWTTSGTLAPTSGTKEVQVPSKGEASFAVDLAADQAIGQGHIQWYAAFQAADGHELDRVTESAPMPVRAPAAFQSHNELIILKPGESTTIRNTKFLDDARTETEVSVGASPQLRLAEALKYVVGYPYGCVEQTTSKCLPMYLLRKSNALTELTLEQGQPIEAYLQAGIDRLFSMQTPSGGLGFWPGASDPYPYGSVYALHFLTLVKVGREIPLPEASFKQLQDYVRKLITDWDGSGHQSDLYLRAYAAYVLAIGGDAEAIRQIQRFDTISVPRSSRLLLAAALAVATKDGDRVKMYMSKAPFQPYTVTEYDGTLNSDVRNSAIELLTLRQIGGDKTEIATKAKDLIAWLEAHRYGTTQETAFIITALAEYLNDLASNIDTTAADIVDPKGSSKISGKQSYKGAFDGPGVVYTVSNTGKTELYVNATTRGIPEKIDSAEVASSMSVSRTLYTEKGELVSGTQYNQSAIYIVGVTLTCERDVKNVVVADLLPAGFEIENPRLEADALEGEAFSGSIVPTYTDVRDDRMVAAFDSLGAGSNKFFYVVRAVTPGTFQQPAVQAECMYDASVRARSVPGTIEVTAN